MKITTWNVNGLRATFRKKAHLWWERDRPDILCFQEVRAQPDQLTADQLNSLDWQSAIWHPAERSGYSGVATFSGKEPEDQILGLGEPSFDREGRLIESIYAGFHLFNVYVPNGRRDLSRLDYKIDFYAQLLSRCKGLHAQGEKVILCGDLNTAHRPLDLRNPKENTKNTGFLPQERAWLDKFLDNGFKDAYRHLYPDREEYTWWTYRFNARQRNIGWRLDYFLVSETLLPQVNDVLVHTEVMGSDHCPVSLILRE